MKIAQICSVDFTLEKFLRPLVEALSERGHEVHVVSSQGYYLESFHIPGVRKHKVEIPRRLRLTAHVKCFFDLIKLFRENKFDAVHVHTPVAGIWVRLAARIVGVKHVMYTAHGFYFHENMNPILYALHFSMESTLSLFTDLLFTQSHEDFCTARKFLNRKCRVIEIGNGVDFEKFDRNIGERSVFRDKYGISKDAVVVCFIGRLVREKGLIELLSSAIELISDRSDVVFVIVGDRLESDRGDDLANDYMFHKSNLFSDKIIFTGGLSDIPSVLAQIDIFCLPSWREGMPRSILEAMAMGKPVVATDIRGCREEVLDGITGLLVQVGNVLELTGALKKLIDDKPLRLKLGDEGYNRASQLYREERVVALQVEMIEEL